MSNYIKYYLRSALYSVAVLFTGTAVLQIFLTDMGVDSIPIGIFTSLLSVVNVLTNIAFSASADRCGNVKRWLSLLCLPIGTCFFLLIPLCFAEGLSVGTAFLLISVICLLQMLFISLYTTLDYKLPYSIIDVQDYGRFASMNGIVCGIVNTTASLLLSEFLENHPVSTVLSVGFGVGGTCMLLAALVNGTLDTSRGKTQVSEKVERIGVFTGFGKILRLRDFLRLILPNFFRGFHMGMLNMAAVIAVSCGFTTGTVGRLVTVSFLGSIVGSVVYMFAARRVKSRRLCLTGSIVTCVGVLIPFCTDNVFLAVYFVMVVGKIMVDYAVPSQVYAMIPPDVACLYQTWRLIVTTAGSVFAAAVSGWFIEYEFVPGFLAIASVCQVVSGLCYLRWNTSWNQREV